MAHTPRVDEAKYEVLMRRLKGLPIGTISSLTAMMGRLLDSNGKKVYTTDELQHVFDYLANRLDASLKLRPEEENGGQ